MYVCTTQFKLKDLKLEKSAYFSLLVDDSLNKVTKVDDKLDSKLTDGQRKAAPYISRT